MSLAERVERANGPDRELDALIAPFQRFRVVEEGHPLGRCCYDTGGQLVVLPRYTASIDAAATLVPEGWVIALTVFSDSATVMLIDDRINPVRLPDVEGNAATPAAALTAAALRSLALQTGGE
jgi:hypothetical protein